VPGSAVVADVDGIVGEGGHTAEPGDLGWQAGRGGWYVRPAVCADGVQFAAVPPLARSVNAMTMRLSAVSQPYENDGVVDPTATACQVRPPSVVWYVRSQP
jgi:hypothetical protein